ncbi:replication-associated recombination protein A [Patescibacteria group bacterium]|nr:replication-associated recombination protein A [Patescibacteria group bacterium]
MESSSEPLASRRRPTLLKDVVGQAHLIGPGAPLRVAIEKKHLFSFILWGPPGVGKTTLARLYASAVNAEYYELSAVSAGKDDIKKIIESTGTLLGPRILFLDEIHRFNKSQQDFLLPYVESGRLTLIGATTENPSFEVIPALLSRCRVFVLESFSETEMKKIITRTGLVVDKDAIKWIVRAAGGDARQALAIIEHTAGLYTEVTETTLEQALQNKLLRYDKKGDEHYNTVSAFIKSMRASQPDAALYYLARMITAGEDPKFIARRMVIFASEDIGVAQPTALVVANEVFRAVETIGLPEAGINLAHGVVHLCMAPKDRRAYDAYNEALGDVKEYGNLVVPLKIRNAATSLQKQLGYGNGYELYTKDDLLPEKLQGKNYFKINKKSK